MKSVSQIKKMLDECPDGWRVELQKWEHISPNSDGLCQGFRGMPNICGVKCIDKHDRVNDVEGGWIRQLVFEDMFDDDSIYESKEDCLNELIGDLKDTDNVEFLLQVEDTRGKFDMVELELEYCDKGYCDKLIVFSLDEK